MRFAFRLRAGFRAWAAPALLAAAVPGFAQQPETVPVPQITPIPGTAPTVVPAGGQVQPAPTAEQRIQSLEMQNAELGRRLDELVNQQEALLNRLNAVPTQAAPLDYETPGQLGRPLPRGADNIGEEEAPARVDISHGIRILSPDGKYRVELHNLTQPEFRAPFPTSPSAAGTNGLVSSFDIPRQRFYFTGSIDKYFDFYSVLNRGYGSLDVLDSYVNLKYDKTFNVRVGRTKTPYGYEYYKIAEGDLIAPERSVFVGNLSPNRQIGAMAFGRLAGESIEYAAAVMNGPRRSFQDFNDAKMVALYVNTKPFLYGSNDALRNLNLGISGNFQRSNDPLEPTAFHTANDETTTSAVANVSPTFLQFNPLAVQKGNQAFWSGDIAYYYRNLTSLIMYDGGLITYNLPNRSGIQVPFEGGSAAFTYFLTGEEIVSRKEIEPLREFQLHDVWNNPGAIEIYTRMGVLSTGNQAFTSGLVDPRLWTHTAYVFDNGVNWYMNRFVRICLDWQHSEYSSPVSLGAGRFTSSTDMFWFRSQIFF
ncbi:MAG TPA: porin [Urbifossiella sp.]|nr:porin [Urbifossiella sp.]